MGNIHLPSAPPGLCAAVLLMLVMLRKGPMSAEEFCTEVHLPVALSRGNGETLCFQRVKKAMLTTAAFWGHLMKPKTAVETSRSVAKPNIASLRDLRVARAAWLLC